MEGMMRIGLTGGIAAGKSTVAQHLNDLGLTVIDYDALARQIVAPGSEGLQRVAQEFGNGAITADGQLNRTWMAEHVFGEHAAPGARERLDAIEHPLIYEVAKRIERSVADNNSIPCNASIPCNDTSPESPAIVVHDVPLLAEVIGSMPFAFAHIVSIEAPEETRVARMIGTRGMSREQALARIRHQSSEAERRALADEVIDATQPIERMFERVDTLVAQWRSELRDSPYR